MPDDRAASFLQMIRRSSRGRLKIYLGYGPDKRPRFCGNPAWQACAHRLACQQCQMYIDAEQAEELEQVL